MTQLARRYRELQSSIHPDRFASADDRTRRISVQSAARVNEAYETLKNPLKRGFYLLELAGVEPVADQRTTSDTAFLMQQMEYRERLDEAPDAADPFVAVDHLRADLSEEDTRLVNAFKSAWAGGETDTARDCLLKLQFFARLKSQLDEIEARLEDQLI